MDQEVMKLRFLILLCLIWRTASQSLNAQHFKLERRQKRCSYGKSHGMMLADCYGLNLDGVPINLRGDIEILEATYNRIRELYAITFKQYGYLKLLFLQDNMINHIEDGAFDPLRSLEVIDLSSNSLDKVPVQILKLPKLRKLYINNNRLTSPAAGFLDAPTSHSLEFLSMANCHLKEFPTLSSLPYLKVLNVSTNELSIITTEDLAPMCNLEALDVAGNVNLFHTKEYLETCENIMSITQCTNSTESEQTAQLYDSCKLTVATMAAAIETRKTWIIVAVVVAVSLVILALALFCFHRYNRRKFKNRRNKFDTIIINNNCNSESMVRQDFISDSET
ncbi:hypothetical protein C0J52_02047 [Blattella germanica]|nr:hypothetical protein C0J52_02047 [Blattella germanica]